MLQPSLGCKGVREKRVIHISTAPTNMPITKKNKNILSSYSLKVWKDSEVES